MPAEDATWMCRVSHSDDITGNALCIVIKETCNQVHFSNNEIHTKTHRKRVNRYL